MKEGKKRGVVSEYLPWLLIALVLLVIVLITIFFLKEKGISLLDQIKNIFRKG
jgi:sensor domain CHASE-containing protein